MKKVKTLESEPTTTPPEIVDTPIDTTLDAEFARCRETQDNPFNAEDLGVAIIQIRVDKAKKNHYFRVMSPPEGGYLKVLMIEGKNLSGVPKDWFVISEPLVKSMGKYGKGIKRYALIPTIDRDGNIRVWPHSITRGTMNSWLESREELFKVGLKNWVRYESNSSEGRFETIMARDQSLEERWPIDLPYQDLVKKAIGDHFVTNHNHPVIRAMMGESLQAVEV
jgi:hypothetical protein